MTRPLPLLFVVACTAACTANDPVAGDPFWTALPSPAFAPPAALGLPADAPAPSPLHSDVEGSWVTRRPPTERGWFAVGNGSVFAMVGMGAPFNTLRAITGPDYDKAGTFFPDVALALEHDGRVATVSRERAWRLEGTAVVVTRTDTQAGTLWSVAFAPWLEAWPTPAGQATPEAHRVLVSRVVVEPAAGVEPSALRLVLLTGKSFSAESGHLSFAQQGRSLHVLERSEPARGAFTDGWWRAPVTPGAALELHVVAVRTGEDPTHVTLPADALARTLASWRAFSAKGVQLDGPARVRALLDANRVAIKVQQSAHGATCPMSNYTRMWNRDISGPVRFYSALGLVDDARAFLDAHWAGVRTRGDYANSYDGAIDPATAPAAPDFEAMTEPFGGRARAEGPSHTPLAYRDLWKATGDAPWAGERLGLLTRAVRGQAVSAEGLLPFSGEETFRPQMSSSFGLPLEFLYEDETWSSNSGFLYVAAAEAVAEVAGQVGRSDVVDEMRERARTVRTATEKAFRAPEGFYRPFLYKDGREPPASPYPDVSMNAAWSGYDAPLSNGHLASVAATVSRLAQPDGGLLLPRHEQYANYMGLTIERGIVAGMSPGYSTWTLARTFDPHTAPAARFLARCVDPGGTWPEVIVWDDCSALMPFFDSGGLGEVWARYRPWEGGINAHALLVALTGLDVDARTRTVRLGPALVEAGPFRLDGVAVGGTTLSVRFTPGTETHAMTVAVTGGEPVRLVVERCAQEDGDTGELEASDADGDELEVASREVNRYGGRVFLESVLDASAGEVSMEWPAGCP